MSQYIYIRDHSSYIEYNVCKLGRTKNLLNRDHTYRTGEYKRGHYIFVAEITENSNDFINKLELQLMKDFKNYYRYDNSGTEFFDRCIINLIEEQIKKYTFNYKFYNNDEINKINLIIEKNINDEIIKKQALIDFSNLPIIKIPKTEQIEIINKTPRPDQVEIINKSIKHFEQNDKGLLILPPSYGKTFISMQLVKQLNYNKILVAVPTIDLSQQWEKLLKDMFPEHKTIIYYNGIKLNNDDKIIIIIVYNSVTKLLNLINDFKFDIKILDECHHVTAEEIIEDKSQFINVLKIPSNKQLSLTATIKVKNNDINAITNDNIDYFGEIIERRCLLSAITQNIICDYKILIISTETQLLNNLINHFNVDLQNKKLFLSAFIALKIIQETTDESYKLLIYSNSTNDSNIIVNYIDKLLNEKYFNIPELYYNCYNNEIKSKTRNYIKNKFEECSFGIISCVYCLSEGYDNIKIDGEVFASNMSAEIRIVQSSMRGGRKNINKSHKINNIILPVTSEILLEKSDDYNTIFEVVAAMGIEDETVTQKITSKIITGNSSSGGIIDIKMSDFAQYIEKLNIDIKKIARDQIKIMSYDKAKKILAAKKFNNKHDYIEFTKIDNRFDEHPDELYNETWKNWCDYLSIDAAQYYTRAELNDVINKNSSELKKFITPVEKIQFLQTDNKIPQYDIIIDFYKLKNIDELFPKKTNKIIKFDDFLNLTK